MANDPQSFTTAFASGRCRECRCRRTECRCFQTRGSESCGNTWDRPRGRKRRSALACYKAAWAEPPVLTSEAADRRREGMSRLQKSRVPQEQGEAEAWQTYSKQVPSISIVAACGRR